MNKSELIEAVSNKTGHSKKDTKDTIEATLDTIMETLAGGDTIPLIGFGTFSTSERKARIGRNPSTGEEIEIKASVVPKFKAGSKMKEMCKR